MRSYLILEMLLPSTLRQGNECADWLVKHGASSSDALKSWSFCPP